MFRTGERAQRDTVDVLGRLGDDGSLSGGSGTLVHEKGMVLLPIGGAVKATGFTQISNANPDKRSTIVTWLLLDR